MKVCRSSQEQFQTYTHNSKTITTVSMCVKNGKLVSMENFGRRFLGQLHVLSIYFCHRLLCSFHFIPINRFIQSKCTRSTGSNGVGVILAMGFPWTVTKADVSAFFADVNIIGGNYGIQIRQNGAMEAIFLMHSKTTFKKHWHITIVPMALEPFMVCKIVYFCLQNESMKTFEKIQILIINLFFDSFGIEYRRSHGLFVQHFSRFK